MLACKRCNWRKADRLPAEVGMHLLRPPRPLTQEYAHIIFLRYPALKAAYDAFCASGGRVGGSTRALRGTAARGGGARASQRALIQFSRFIHLSERSPTLSSMP